MKEPKHRWRTYASFAGALLLLVGLAVTLAFIHPTELVEMIGVRNSYIVIFVLALLGGVSSFTSTSFYATIFTFAAGGSHPIIIGLLAGMGMTAGDAFFYYLGTRGRDAFLIKYDQKIDKAKRWLENRPPWSMPLIIYAYTGMTPLPGDILMIALAIIKYPFKKMVVPVILGSMTITTLIALAGYYGIRVAGLA